MRLVRECVFLLAILSLAAVPVIGVGCSDQGATNPAASGETKIELGKKETKPTSPKSPGKKARSADESGSTTGSLGVKPPKAPTTAPKQ
jgi:hypothetical protein